MHIYITSYISLVVDKYTLNLKFEICLFQPFYIYTCILHLINHMSSDCSIVVVIVDFFLLPNTFAFLH